MQVFHLIILIKYYMITVYLLFFIHCSYYLFNQQIFQTGWIWTRESQREIQNAKAQYDKDVSLIKSEMEARYRATLTESHRKAATLELELEKEKQKVKGYRQALISQSQHQMEQQKQLQQVCVFFPFCYFNSLLLNILVFS